LVAQKYRHLLQLEHSDGQTFNEKVVNQQFN